MRLLYLLILLLVNAVTFSQTDADYYSARFLKYEDYTYDSNIKTVILERNGEPLSDPVLTLKSEETLLLQFDLLDNEIEDYSYRIIHCDPDWKSSELSENEFIDGFNTDQISDYKHSLNTLEDYWHYQLIFPNAQMKPIISGNYLMVVFPTNDPDSIIITRRFLVVESKIQISGNAHRATVIEYRNTHQEIDFKINTTGIALSNPYGDLKVTILQNFNFSTSLTNIQPLFASNEELDYNLEQGNIMEAGSEYRILDLRTNKFLTQSIERIERDSIHGKMTTVLKPDLRLGTQRYSTNEDINGKFLIKIYEGRDAHLEGDYIHVKFRLKAIEDDSNLSYFIDGKFTDYQPSKKYRLEYNEVSGFYEKTLYIKQGYYNYRYITFDSKSQYSVIETEGSHYETRNVYDILVYWKANGTRYFQLIGDQKIQAGAFDSSIQKKH
ncbi:MAG: DUF5103 domain-containing protein [Bacteroidetes bacterium]|nr:DUF5103 domain-containing protein [Bacteroidota bacterium]